MATKLNLFNNALLHLGELNLSSLTEAREPRRVLDQVYDSGFINTVLEKGYWKFAARTVKLDFDANVTPTFGHRNVFSKPTDFVHICKVCTDEFLDFPLLHYQDEGSFFYSDLDEIFIQFVSNGSTYGGDLTTWPESFTKYAELYLAASVCTRITHSDSMLKAIFALMKKAEVIAKSKDAIKNPTQFRPSGTWVTSRSGGRRGGGRADGGSRSSFLG